MLIAAAWAGQTWAELDAKAVADVEDPTESPSGPLALVGGTVLTATGERHEVGTVSWDASGRITRVASGVIEADVVLDVSGMYVTPGIIDTHSHLGVYASPRARAHSDGNEVVGPNTAEVWSEHGIWPQDPGFARAVAGGVTALHILPGSANLIGGRSITIRPIPARGGRAMAVPGAPQGVKMACGENPKRVYGDRGGPHTRMGNVAGYRAAFAAAAEYGQKWQAWDAAQAAQASGKRRRKGSGPKEPPKRDLRLDTLWKILLGDALPQVHCYRSDDMVAFLQVADEFGFAVRSFHHAIEAYKVRDILADRGISVSTWADWWGFKMESWDAVPANAALVAEAGGRAVIHSDSAIGIQRLNQEAAKAWVAGRDAGVEHTEDEALRWITANPAWTLGLEEQTGQLRPGLRADVVVWDAHPFSVYAKPTYVFIDGRLVWDASEPGVWSDFEIGLEVSR